MLYSSPIFHAGLNINYTKKMVLCHSVMERDFCPLTQAYPPRCPALVLVPFSLTWRL